MILSMLTKLCKHTSTYFQKILFPQKEDEYLLVVTPYFSSFPIL